MSWERRGDDLWVETGEAWTGRTCTVDPEDPRNRQRRPMGEDDDAAPVWTREPGPSCPPGWYSPPCPWELRWPAEVIECPTAALAPWWATLGPWGPSGDALAPPFNLAYVTITAGSRRDGATGSVERDPLRGTYDRAKAHICTNGIVVEAMHSVVQAGIGRAGSLLSIALPTVASFKDLASDATKRTHSMLFRAYVPHWSTNRVEASATFGNTRPLLGKWRREFDTHGRGQLTSARIDIDLHDGWRRQVISLRMDGDAAGWPYEATQLESWLDRLQQTIQTQKTCRSRSEWSAPHRWQRTIECDGAVPLCVPGQSLLPPHQG